MVFLEKKILSVYFVLVNFNLMLLFDILNILYVKFFNLVFYCKSKQFEKLGVRLEVISNLDPSVITSKFFILNRLVNAGGFKLSYSPMRSIKPIIQVVPVD